eukprot:Colp12_sorted_trinity150504_noHs@18884
MLGRMGFKALFVVFALMGIVSADFIDLKCLLLASTESSGELAMATSILQGYGLAYTVMTIPREGVSGALQLESDPTHALYSCIIFTPIVYNYNGVWQSPLTTDQLAQIDAYERKWSVRRVVFQVFPSASLGVEPVNAVNMGTDRNHQIRLATYGTMLDKNLNPNMILYTEDLWHYPTRIVNDSMVTPVLTFDADAPDYPEASTAAAVATFPDGRQHFMIFFAQTSFSLTSIITSHLWLQFVTKGLYVGNRKVLLNTQVEHVFSSDALSAGGAYRLTAADLDAHAAWIAKVNSRLPL